MRGTHPAELSLIVDTTEARQAALKMLARREHSRRELCDKLLKKGYAQALVDATVKQLEQERFVSDDRFVESLIQARRNRGYGPLRIQQELREKGVAAERIEAALDCAARQWLDDIERLCQRRFGENRPKGIAARAKQARFLQYRGFTSDQIAQVLGRRLYDG